MLRARAHAVQSTPLVTRAGAVLGVVSSHYAEPTLVSTRALDLVELYARRAASLIELRDPIQGHHLGRLRLTSLIRHKLRLGLLPREEAPPSLPGHGSGETCSACEATIAPVQAEYDVTSAGRTYCFHLGCFRLWESERRREDLADQAATARNAGME
jgi:hypothetical protein